MRPTCCSSHWDTRPRGDVLAGAEPTLDELQAKLDSEELSSARETAARPNLDELVSETLGDRLR
jgi:hypothetical protein